MAISFVGAGAVVTGVNPTVAVPAGVVEKDLLIIITTGTGTATTPTGWTQGGAQGATSFLTLLYKFAGTTEASVALTLPGSTAKSVMIAYRGASILSGFATSTATGTSITSAAITTLYADQYVVNIFGSNNVAGAWTAPASTNSRVNSAASSVSNGLLIVDASQAAPGLSATRTATIVASHTLSSATFTIIPGGDHYWVGGAGTWNTTSTTNWSFSSGGATGAPPPGPVDSVFFDQAATYTVTMTGALTCGSMTTSAGTVTFATGTTPTLAVSGAMTLLAGTLWTNTGALNFTQPAGATRTITTNGVTINSPITFLGTNGSAGGWTLGSALNTGTTVTTTLTFGTLTLNGFDLTTGSFSSSNTNGRIIAFGTNNIVLAHTTAAQTVLNMAIVTGFALASTTTGGFTSDASVTRTFTFGTTGGSATNAPNLSLTGSGTAIATLTTASWFDDLNFGTTAFNPGTTALSIAGSLTLSSGGTFTTLTATMVGTGTLTSNTNTTLAALTINSTAGTTTLGAAFSMSATGTVTLTSGALNLNGFDLTTGIFSSSVATARSIAFGTNNIVLAHTTAATVVLSMATATGFTYTGTGGFTATAAITRTYTFGTTGGTAANAPNLSLTGSGTAVQTLTTASWFGTLSFGSTAFNPGTTALNLNGLTLSSGGTFTTLSATMRGTGTITPAGKTIAAFTVNNSAGTVTLAAALGVTTYTQTAGTIDFATFNLTCSGAVAYTAGTLSNIGTISCTTWTVTGAFTLSSGTITPSVSFVLTSGSFTYSGGTLSPVPTFTHTAGTVTLGQNYSLTSTGTYTLTAGTLDMTDRNLTAAAFITSGTGVRAINFGTSGYGEITVTGNNVTIWDGGGANITYTGTPRIYASYTGSVGTRTVNLGTAWTEATAFDVTVQGSSYYFVSGFQILSTGGNPTDTVAISGVAKAFNMVNFSFAVTPGAMTIYGDYNIPSIIYSGTINASASTTTFAATTTQNIQIDRAVDFPITFNGVGGTFTLNASTTGGPTKAMTLTAGALVVNGSSAISTGTFVSTGTGTRSINFNSNNITLTNATAATTVLSMADATNFTIAGSGGFISDLGVTKTFSFGSTAGGSAANAPNLTFTTGAAVPTITTGSWFNSLNFGSTTSTPATTAISVSTLTLASGGTYTGLTPSFTSTQTWTPQFSKQLGGFGINIPGGTLTLGGSQSLIATATTTLTAGTLDLNGNDLTTGIFSSSNTNTRAIAFGSNNINLTHTTAATTVLSMADATNFTLTDSGGGFVSNLAVTRTFQFGSTAGGSATNAPNLAITSGAAIPTITTNSWFDALNFTGTTATPAAATVFVSTLTLATGGTYTALTPIFTRTQTWTTQFGKQLGGIGFNLAGGTLTLGDSPSLVATGTTTLTAGTLDLGGFNLTTGIFSSTNTNTRSIAFGTNNIVLVTTAAATTVVSMAIATGFSCTGTGGFTTDASITRTITIGTSGVADATNAPNVSLTGAGVAIITISTTSFIKNLNFGTTAFALPVCQINVAGDLTLSSGGTFTSLTLITVGTGTITSNTRPIAAFTINSVSGTTTLGDALSLVATGITTLTSGALVLNNFTLTTGTFSSGGTNVRSIAFGSGNIVLATTTAAAVNLSMATATNFTCTSSGTYGSGTGGFQATMSVTRTFQFGQTANGSAANAPRLYLVSGASVPTITTGSWFSEIDFGTTAFTIAATNLNLSSLKSNLSTSVLTALTATMVGSGSIRTNTSIGPLVINTSAITTTLAGTTLCTTAALTQGTLDLAGQTLTCSSTFTYNGGSLLTASGVLNCTTFTINGPAFNFTSGTITPSTSFVLTSGSFTLNGGTLSAVPAFTHTAGTATFNTSYALTATGTYTFTAGTLSLSDGVTLSTGIFSSTNTNTRSIAFGATTAGYVSLTHTTAATTRLSMATATGFTKSGPGGFTSSMDVTATFTFGTTGGSSSNAPRLLITGGAAIPTFTTGSWFDLLDFTGNTSTPAATVLNLNALTLAVGGTYTALGATMVGTGTITPAGKTIAAFTVNNGVGTVTLAGALGATTYTQTAGTIDFATFNLTCSGAAAYTLGTLNNIGTISCTTWTVTGAFTFGQGTITPSTSFVLTSGSFTYNVGATLSAVPTFTHTAGTVTLNQSYALTATGTYTLTAGTLTLADGVTVNTGIFSSTNSNTRSIAFGSASAGNINLTHTTAATTVLSMATATGFTLTGTGGFTVADMSNTRTFNFGATAGGSVTNAPSLTFTTGASVATLTTASWFDNLNFGTTSFNPGTTALNIAGDLTLSATGTYTTMTPTMLGTGTITSNNNTTLVSLIINSTSGTTTLAAPLSLTATSTTTLTSGTLALNSYNLTTGIFSSSNTNTRSIAFGGSTPGTSASFNGSTQYASYAINSNIKVTANQPFTVEFWIYTPTQVQTAPAVFGTSNDGGQTGDTAFFVGHSGLGITNQYGFYLAGLTGGVGGAGTTTNLLASTGNYIKNAWTHIALVRVGTDAIYMYINGVLNATATYSGAINFPTDTLWVGTSGNNFPGSHYTGYISNFRWATGVAVYTGNFTVPTAPLTATQSSGTNISAITGTQTSILLNTVTGANILTDSSTNNYTPTNNGSITGVPLNPFTGLVNLAHTTAAQTVLNMAIATAFTYTGTGGFAADATVTRTYVFGTTGGSTTISPSLSLTGSGTAVQTFTTASWFNTLDFGSTAFTVAATALNLNGLTLSSGGTFTNLTSTMVGTGTITSNGKTLAALTVNTTGTATLADALAASGALTLTQGTLAGSTFSVTSATFVSTGSLTRSMNGSGTYTITGAGATAFSNASATGITIVGLIISMTAATAKTFAGGGGSFSTLNQGGAGALTISGSNSFSDLTATTRPSTITFTASSTQTFTNFTLSGILGSLVTINSTVASTRATLSKSSGTVSVNYLSIRDSNATGGAGWYAGTTSTNVSNNLGWIFTAPPTPGGAYAGNFFAFF